MEYGLHSHKVHMPLSQHVKSQTYCFLPALGLSTVPSYRRISLVLLYVKRLLVKHT